MLNKLTKSEDKIEMLPTVLWSLLKDTNTLLSIAKNCKNFYNQSVTDKKKKQLTEFIDFSKIPEDQHHFVEKVENYILQYNSIIIEDNLFSNEEKENFIQSFFKQYPELSLHKSEIIPILKNYIKSVESFLNSDMTPALRLICRTHNELLNHIYIIKDLLEKQQLQKDDSKKVFMDNLHYAESFTAKLFLHKNDENSKVNLLNLFILQKYKKLLDRNHLTEIQDHLDNELAHFLSSNTAPFLIVEGDPGCGKSSLISWMNYHYFLQDDICKKLLGQRPLITIRLRDLDRKVIGSTGRLVSAILSHMHLKTLDDLENLYPNAVFVLDGFDELCMIDNITNYESMLSDLCRKNLRNTQFIVTTRPKYIIYQYLPIKFEYIILEHFDQQQRMQWLRYYTGTDYCNQYLDKDTEHYIKTISDKDASGICDTPLTLYMIAAKKLSSDALNNPWALYHQIFYDELNETEYNQMIPNPNREYAHRISDYKDILYRISEEIAYKMYCSGNTQLYISGDEIKEIIEALNNFPTYLELEQSQVKAISERCYALCNYWKSDMNRGYVEFYHNNIRDFFLCEKIYTELNLIYDDLEKTKFQKSRFEAAVDSLCKLFQYNSLETPVCKFMVQRLLYAKQHSLNVRPDFPFLEKKMNYFPFIYEELLTNGYLYSDINSQNPIQSIINILTCVAQIFKYTGELLLETDRQTREKEKFIWWKSANNVNSNGLLAIVFGKVFSREPIHVTIDKTNSITISLAGNSNFIGIDLSGSYLRAVSFSGSDLSAANLSYATLIECELSNAQTRNANFTETINKSLS